MGLAGILRFLTYPLLGGSLPLIAVFSILLTIAGAGGLLGLPLAIIVLSWFFKYGFVLLDHAADGATEPPALSLDMVNPASEQRPLAFFAIAAAFYALTRLLEPSIGSGAVHILRMIGVLILPAMLMVQGATQSVLRSLDPRAIVLMILKVRTSYVLVLAAIAALYVVVLGVRSLIPEEGLPYALPLPVAEVLRLALILYGWLACFSLAGGVLYEHRNELGLEPTHSPEQTAAKVNRDRQHELDRLADGIFAEWRGGSFANAWARVQAHARASQEPLDAMIELYHCTENWSDQRLAHRIAQDVLPKLLSARSTGKALDITRARLRRDPQFRPLLATETLRLAELARDAGDRPTARTLLREFANRYPEDPALAAAETLARQLER